MKNFLGNSTVVSCGNFFCSKSNFFLFQEAKTNEPLVREMELEKMEGIMIVRRMSVHSVLLF